MTSGLTSEIAFLEAHRRLDLIGKDRVITWADQKVATGEEDPVIVELAALYPHEYEKVDCLLRALARSFGYDDKSDHWAAMLVAAHMAEQLSKGELEPIELARKFWHIATLVPASEPHLRPFIELASYWEDEPDCRSSYEEEIRSLALNFQR